MNRYTLYILLILLHSSWVFSQTRIIDMHIHSYSDADYGVREMDGGDSPGTQAPATAEDHRKATFVAFKELHIVKAVVSGNPESVEAWASKDTESKVIRGILMYTPQDYGMDTVKFVQMIKDKKIEVFGELGPYYAGTSLSDPIWQPYLRICERYDIPVAVHTGGGGPGGTYTWSPKARLALGDPYLVEDVLVNYPKLRLYLMHAGGEDWPEHAIRLMAYYPQLYIDLAVLLWVEPNTQRYSVELLRNLQAAGFLDRVMFGSDQMVWPEAIKLSVDFLNNLDFLTEKEKEGIFYTNAARFLRIER